MMIRKSVLRFVYAISLLVVLIAPAATAESDVQLWSDIDLAGEISERFHSSARQSFRFKDDVTTLETYFTEFTLTHRTRPWLDLCVAYRQQFEKVTGIDWIEENRPFGDLIVKWVWGPLRISNRTRLEYRVREQREDQFRIRNKFTELLDLPLRPMHVRPYCAQEIFGDDGDVKLADASRFRAYVGLRADPEDRFLFVKRKSKDGRQIKTDAFLMYENREQAEGTLNTFVMGIKFGLSF